MDVQIASLTHANHDLLDSEHRPCENFNFMPHYAYILRCADGRFYYGSTGDLSHRLAEHHQGLSRWTAPRRPVKLVYFEQCETLAQARQREQAFKNGRTRRKTLDRRIAEFPPEKLAPFA